ncbi:MAG: hypothetical protein VKN56_10670, partial [Cyanobacteriota bacterium]|nr:hypothetical protein [Cyanobacteriota bacterium]
RPFLHSLLASGYSGDIVLFVLDSDLELRCRLEADGVRVVSYNPIYPHLPPDNGLAALPDACRSSRPPVR